MLDMAEAFFNAWIKNHNEPELSCFARGMEKYFLKNQELRKAVGSI